MAKTKNKTKNPNEELWTRWKALGLTYGIKYESTEKFREQARELSESINK